MAQTAEKSVQKVRRLDREHQLQRLSGCRSISVRQPDAERLGHHERDHRKPDTDPDVVELHVLIPSLTERKWQNISLPCLYFSDGRLNTSDNFSKAWSAVLGHVPAPQRRSGHPSPISSFHTAGFARIYSLNSETHSCESRSITLTPSERSQSTPPWKFRLSPTITVLKPNCRTSPLQYQQGASVVTMMSLR